MGNIIDVIGFTACAIVLYAWLEPKLGRSYKRERKYDAEMQAKAKQDLIRAINEYEAKKHK